MTVYKINKWAVFKNLGFTITIILFFIGYTIFNNFSEQSNDLTFFTILVLGSTLISISIVIDYFYFSTKGTIIINNDNVIIKRKNKE